MDTMLQLVQIAFYITIATVAVMTFLKAKRGLLNSVNTEYQKKVLDRLANLSEEIYEEFDPSSNKYWAKERAAKEVLERIHEEIKPFKHEIITSKEIGVGKPMPKRWEELRSYLDKIKSDPFIPHAIRYSVATLLEKRVETIFLSYVEELDAYFDGLKEGKYWSTLEDNEGWFHNKINERLYANNCGISQVEEAAHEIRKEIQDYFQAFDPIK